MAATKRVLATLGWSVVFGGVYVAAMRDRRTAIVLALCVMPHWVLDWDRSRGAMGAGGRDRT